MRAGHEHWSFEIVLPSGTELVAFDKVDEFHLVCTPDGALGWTCQDNVVRITT